MLIMNETITQGRHASDITLKIRKYRKIISSLWKEMATEKAGAHDWDLCDDFADLCGHIFDVIVMRPFRQPENTKAKQYDARPPCIRNILVKPLRLDDGFYAVANEESHSLVWEKINLDEKEEMDFSFVDIYDFELYKTDRPFAYVLTKIIRINKSQPDEYMLFPFDAVSIYLIK